MGFNEKKYKLLFVVFNLKGGGAERVTITLANALANRGHKVTVFLFYNENDYSGELSEIVNVVSVLPKNYKFRYGIGKILRTLLNEVDGNDIVIGGLEGWVSLFSWGVARIKNKVCIAWLHIALAEYSKARWNYISRVFFTLPYSGVDKTICVSDGVMDSLLTFTNTTPLAAVIYNPLLKSHYNEPSVSSPIPVILGVGRLENVHKGFDLLIKAHSKLISKGILHKLVIVGEGEDRKSLEELATREGVQDSVSMPGFTENISEFYRSSDIFVLSSRFEGFGMVILEAMSYGVPVVATDCKSGPRELLCGGEFGELVRSESVEALAQGIKKLLLDKKYRKTLADKGLMRVKDFEPDLIAQKWEQLFNEIGK